MVVVFGKGWGSEEEKRKRKSKGAMPSICEQRRDMLNLESPHIHMQSNKRRGMHGVKSERKFRRAILRDKIGPCQ